MTVLLSSNYELDTKYDFRTDCGGVDPDKGSPTLRRYHRILWSKKLPNGEIMQLTHDNGGYLKWKEFEFGSDAMANGLFFERAKKTVAELKELLPDYDAFVEDYEHRGWTIGGEIIFPKHNKSMNQYRGTNAYILDRWDLTLECIRRFYLGESSPLYEVLDRDRKFYNLFVDFRGYVDFFFLQDCVTPDYKKVVFWHEDCSLNHTLPLPKTGQEHLEWIERNLQFVEKRADRMQKALESDPTYKRVGTTEYQDDYFEILDEIVNLLIINDSIAASTKGLRATRYSNGYARYIRINDYCCGILFDKDNWQSTELADTPFWLAIYDSDWKISKRIELWLDNQKPHLISRKWNKYPCIALIPPVNASFHQVCDCMLNQIINTLKEIDKI